MWDTILTFYVGIGLVWTFFTNWSVDRSGHATMLLLVMSIFMWPLEMLGVGLIGIYHVWEDLTDKED